jgi:hypothetical protein
LPNTIIPCFAGVTDVTGIPSIYVP